MLSYQSLIVLHSTVVRGFLTKSQQLCVREATQMKELWDVITTCYKRAGRRLKNRAKWVCQT